MEDTSILSEHVASTNVEMQETESKKKNKRKLEHLEPEIATESNRGKKKKKKNKHRAEEVEVSKNGSVDLLKMANGEGEDVSNKNKAEEVEVSNNGSVDLSKKANEEGEDVSNKHKAEEVEISNNGSVDLSKMANEEGEDVSNKNKAEEVEVSNNGSVDLSKMLNGEGEDVSNNGSVELNESGYGVIVSGEGVNDVKFKPLEKFSDSGLPEKVLECCKIFEKPSLIQSHSWPFLLNGRDFIGIAATGSGKTLAYGIPAIMHVMNNRKGKKPKNPLCLVLSPTRELAQQISDVLCDAGKPTGTVSVCLYGGSFKRRQIFALKSGVDIVIGTPGRIKELIEMGKCQLKEVSFVILDEADRMLDMGFELEVRSVLTQTSSARQMVMFSATWPPPVHKLAQEFMDPNPVKVVVGSEAANHDVVQIVEVLEGRQRFERLLNLLEKYHESRRNRVLVFVSYKKEASQVEHCLGTRGWKAVSISGDKAQDARKKALSLFKKGSCPLMIATDVAARGLDIPDVEVVINYGFPRTIEDYIHRIGRTGRAGKKGVAHTLFTEANKELAGELINVLKEAGQIVPAELLNFGTHVKKKEPKPLWIKRDRS